MSGKVAAHRWVEWQDHLFCLLFYIDQPPDLLRIQADQQAERGLTLHQHQAGMWNEIHGSICMGISMFTIAEQVVKQDDVNAIPFVISLYPTDDPLRILGVDIFNKIWELHLDLTNQAKPLIHRLLYAHPQWRIQTLISYGETLLLSCKDGIIRLLDKQNVQSEYHLPPGRIGLYLLRSTECHPFPIVIDKEGDVYRLLERDVQHCTRLQTPFYRPLLIQSTLLYLWNHSL